MNADLMNILMQPDASKLERISSLLSGPSNFQQDKYNGPLQSGMKQNPMHAKKPEYYLEKTMENRRAPGRI